MSFLSRSRAGLRAGLLVLAFGTLLLPAHAHLQPAAPETALLFLSGHGPDDAVEWEFFCTAGRRSREWTTIPVPSCWEQQGFGTYNYGNEINADAAPVGNEQGLYRRPFTVPAGWRGRRVRIVFDGAMTDTTVWVNGQQAGPTHQGGFYRFHYDITPLVRYGEPNLLEVTVAKVSGNRSVNDAERAADYWVFGGLYRPVWLEARPETSIERAAIDARGDGRVSIDVFLAGGAAGAQVVARIVDAAGRPVGEPLRSAGAPENGKVVIRGRVESPRAWTAETPNLYGAHLTLTAAGGDPLHSTSVRFGFRTIEVREGDGVYLNGTRIVLKGVNRHAFWPETGRTVSREQSYADVRLIKEANLNAVRMSHYPPDEHFLDACDELGLYVLDELAGWQKAYGTAVGARLIGQMVRRDVNHPSILFWDNGNERGWNEKNDGEFAKWDPQARTVLHPIAISGGIDTDHYETYDDTVKRSAGPLIFMPTEFLHGLYDGGIGAGLRDYWDVMGRSPTVAGGFLWAWSDEGIVRADQDGRIDTAGNQAPDGMVGPHREKEGSYFAVKEIWSPIQVSLPLDGRGELSTDWDGAFAVENAYDFTSLDRCRFDWQLLRIGAPDGSRGPTLVVAAGTVPAPALAPRTSGTTKLPLPRRWRQADALHLTARGPGGESLWTWSAGVPRAETGPRGSTGGPATVREEAGALVVAAPAGDLRFDRRTGQLVEWRRGGRVAPLGSGVSAQAFVRSGRTHVPVPGVPGLDPGVPGAELVSLSSSTDRGDVVVEARYRGILRRATWRIGSAGEGVRLEYEVAYDGEVDLLGVSFGLPSDGVLSKRWLGRGPYRIYRNRLEGGVFDLHTVRYNDPVPGQSFTYPEFKGYFRDWRWLQLETTAGTVTVENRSSVPFFGLYGPRDGEPPMLGFPDTGLALLHVIPAQGTKFDTPDRLGPQSQTPRGAGAQQGSVLLRFTPADGSPTGSPRG
ncbi:MAG TPA: glycoside hydrolase family 2 TIM barrel-domain containing protein [Vicinamibacterales bacterium]|nr:glycoside hydrolase family 2 TIM barrel-domain containing protein [Vicinamibacterales bacterium]